MSSNLAMSDRRVRAGVRSGSVAICRPDGFPEQPAPTVPARRALLAGLMKEPCARLSTLPATSPPGTARPTKSGSAGSNCWFGSCPSASSRPCAGCADLLLAGYEFPAGLLLMFASLFSVLPVLGLWMLPLGLVLLADDVPPLRRATGRILDWIEHRRPHWMGLAQAS